MRSTSGKKALPETYNLTYLVFSSTKSIKKVISLTPVACTIKVLGSVIYDRNDSTIIEPVL